MKKNAFTLTELIIIIVIIGVILVFSLPKITSTVERNNKEVMISDAKDFVEKTKQQLTLTQNYPSVGQEATYKLSEIDSRVEIDKSPYGNAYDRENSIVVVWLEGNTLSYAVKLIEDKYELSTINSSNGIKRDYSVLNGNDKYTFIKRK